MVDYTESELQINKAMNELREERGEGLIASCDHKKIAKKLGRELNEEEKQYIDAICVDKEKEKRRLDKAAKVTANDVHDGLMKMDAMYQRGEVRPDGRPVGAGLREQGYRSNKGSAKLLHDQLWPGAEVSDIMGGGGHKHSRRKSRRSKSRRSKSRGRKSHKRKTHRRKTRRHKSRRSKSHRRRR